MVLYKSCCLHICDVFPPCFSLLSFSILLLFCSYSHHFLGQPFSSSQHPCIPIFIKKVEQALHSQAGALECVFTAKQSSPPLLDDSNLGRAFSEYYYIFKPKSETSYLSTSWDSSAWRGGFEETL